MADSGSFTASGLAHLCRRETDLYFRGEPYNPEFCLELLRRALASRDDQAWTAVFHVYHPLVLSWVRRHPVFPDCGEEEEYFVNRSFERMWTNLSPEKFDPSTRLPEVLNYLKMCVNSAIIDHSRRLGPPTVPERDSGPIDPGREPVSQAEWNIEGEELWALIKTKVNNEKELRFVFAYFVLGLKPREIYSEYPGLFESVQEINRIRENILSRWRRDSDFNAFR